VKSVNPKDLLVILAKEPRLRLAKTRLAADIGSEAALRLAEAFVLDTLELARASGHPVLIAYAPTDGGPWFKERAPWALRWAQPEGGFGERLHGATLEAFRRGFKRCVIMGMDTPHLPHGVVREAFRALDASDVCLGPASDGGYYLIGLTADAPTLFRKIPWSTSAVLGATLMRCAKAGLTVSMLEEEFDVDDARSLAALAATLEERPEVAPLTRALRPFPRKS
jgi:rSAM/selenodomain-associated transferase 1